MNQPGFTAQTSLYTSPRHYRTMTTAHGSGMSSRLAPEGLLALRERAQPRLSSDLETLYWLPPPAETCGNMRCSLDQTCTHQGCCNLGDVCYTGPGLGNCCRGGNEVCTTDGCCDLENVCYSSGSNSSCCRANEVCTPDGCESIQNQPGDCSPGYFACRDSIGGCCPEGSRCEMFADYGFCSPI